MKTCFKCLASKPLSEFYAHPAMADGHLGKCKDCAKADVLKNRLANIDAIREYDRLRGSLKHRKDAMQIRARKSYAKDKRPRQCVAAVRRAIEIGLLVRHPCIRCGSLKSHGHHESYNFPLAVTWLCQLHHKERHKEMVAAGIDPYLPPTESQS